MFLKGLTLIFEETLFSEQPEIYWEPHLELRWGSKYVLALQPLKFVVHKGEGGTRGPPLDPPLLNLAANCHSPRVSDG